MYDFQDTIRGTPQNGTGIELTFGSFNITNEMNNSEREHFYVANTTGRDVLDFSHRNDRSERPSWQIFLWYAL